MLNKGYLTLNKVKNLTFILLKLQWKKNICKIKNYEQKSSCIPLMINLKSYNELMSQSN